MNNETFINKYTSPKEKAMMIYKQQFYYNGNWQQKKNIHQEQKICNK